VRNICNSEGGEPAAPASGRFACISAWVENLPEDCDLNSLSVAVDGIEAAPVYIGVPVFDGLVQVNAALPFGVRTGLVPVELMWCGQPLADGWVRVIPPGPSVPRVVSLMDGVNLLSGTKIVSRSVKICMEELTAPEQLRASVDGVIVPNLDLFCTHPGHRCYEVNFDLPPAIAPGPHQVVLQLRRRRFAPLAIEVAG
jgi:hypothetical protein